MQTENNKYLFLDDLRNPADCLSYMSNRKSVDINIYHKKWHIVRTYSEFVTWIETHGLPDLISFDHDLADFTEEGQEYTGMDCAKWLVDYCIDNKVQCPEFYVHSANPQGADNIGSLLENYQKHFDK